MHIKQHCMVIGPSSGSKLIFIDPDIGTCFETLGLSGVMKSLSSLLNVEYQMLSRDEQTYLLNMMVSVQTHLGESIFWNGEYENVLQLHFYVIMPTLGS